MSEGRIVLQHAMTVLVGQLAVMAYGVTDTLVAGRVSSEAMAALAVGSAVYISVFVALMGVVQALLPIWAELNGAGRPREVGRSLRQSLYLCAATIALGVALLLSPGPMLEATGVPPALQGPVTDYLAVLALALPASLLFRVYATLNQAIGQPRLVTWLQIGSLAVKIPLSIALALGWGPIPALGLPGCAWATVIVNHLIVLTSWWLLRTDRLYAPYEIWKPLERPHWRTLRSFVRLGVPTALSIFVEVTSFTLMSLYVARMGTEATASQQIASNLAALCFMVPLSLGVATSARVSHWMGMQQKAQALRVLHAGLAMTLAAAALTAAALIWGREGLASLYAAGRPEIASIAATLLVWVGIYHVFDATQGFCAYVLRCYRVATLTLLIYGVMLWGVGLAGGYHLAYRGQAPLGPMLHPSAFWIAATIAVAVTAALFTALLVTVSRRWQPQRSA